jgi:2,3-bisphosphoglycerate-independent phosphoglycerate mutase
MTEKMKYMVIVGDGMADYPIESLGGKTPLGAAHTPHMDWMAKHGEFGLVKTVPDGFLPGSEIANLSIMGYDPAVCFTGRGPIEAASMGVKLGPKDIAFRCNLVTLGGGGTGTFMEDFSAGHIKDDEARSLILDLNQKAGTEEVRFHAGVSYRHLMVWKKGASTFPGLATLPLTPPHDIIGKEIAPYLPGKPGEPVREGVKELLRLVTKSREILRDHPVNRSRQAEGHAPANSIWLWGQGGAPRMISLKERFGIDGCVISAVHLIKGIGMLAGLDIVDVPGATGFFDTNYEGKARHALDGLKEKDFVFVHVEAPDEAGHMGDLRVKQECIETFDRKIVGPILEGMKGFQHYKVLVLPDHPTPIILRTHTSDPIPFALYANLCPATENPVEGFDESSAKQTGLFIPKGHELMERFLNPTCAKGGNPWRT